eukprot:jgi/Botrbrau1/19760/Bobra.0124s0013.1
MAGCPSPGVSKDIWLFPVVDVRVSGAVLGSISGVWQMISNFGNMGDYSFPVDGQRLRTALMPGHHTTEVGAKRVLHIGNGRLYEELTAIDVDKFTLSYKLVNDVNNVNPFPASFLNATTRIRLRPITMSGHTLVEIHSKFNTEQSMVQSMRMAWQKIFEGTIDGLHHSLNNGNTQDPPHHQSQARSAEAGVWPTQVEAHPTMNSFEHAAMTMKPFAIMEMPAPQATNLPSKGFSTPFACLPPLARRESLTTNAALPGPTSSLLLQPETPRPSRLNSLSSVRSRSSSISVQDRSGSLAWSMELDSHQVGPKEL